MPTRVDQVPDSWVFDPTAVENNVSRNARRPMWDSVIAALRLIDGAQRTTSTRRVHMLQAAANRLAHARLQLPQYALAEPEPAHWTALLLTTDAQINDNMRDDTDWLRDALAEAGEPAERHIAAVLDSLADNVIATLLRLKNL